MVGCLGTGEGKSCLDPALPPPLPRFAPTWLPWRLPGSPHATVERAQNQTFTNAATLIVAVVKNSGTDAHRRGRRVSSARDTWAL